MFNIYAHIGRDEPKFQIYTYLSIDGARAHTHTYIELVILMKDYIVYIVKNKKMSKIYRLFFSKISFRLFSNSSDFTGFLLEEFFDSEHSEECIGLTIIYCFFFLCLYPEILQERMLRYLQ